MSMKSTDRGFTIIEVMLVLAVTGLMLIGVFVGANAQISTQRYHDSVTSLQADLQDEYSQVLNVANDRTPGACPTGGSPASSSRGADVKCLILGRLVHGTTIPATSTTTLTSASVIGISTSGNPSDSLMPTTNWTLTTAGTADSYTVKWGSTVKALTGGGTSNAFSALIIVSPENGMITTYVDPTNATRTPTNLLQAGNSAVKNLDLCVLNTFDVFTGNPLAVRVDAGASGGGGIEVPKQSDNVCQGVS